MHLFQISSLKVLKESLTEPLRNQIINSSWKQNQNHSILYYSHPYQMHKVVSGSFSPVSNVFSVSHCLWFRSSSSLSFLCQSWRTETNLLFRLTPSVLHLPTQEPPQKTSVERKKCETFLIIRETHSALHCAWTVHVWGHKQIHYSNKHCLISTFLDLRSKLGNREVAAVFNLTLHWN